MSDSKTTNNHDEIKKWVEARGGKPAIVKGTGSDDDVGLLRINFPGGAEDSLEDISWDQFFQEFDRRGLEFLYQDETSDHKVSRFFKLINAQ
jgi:hypothetical protein